MNPSRFLAGSIGLSLLSASAAFGDLVLYNNSPGSYGNVTTSLNAEYGTASFPPLAETSLSYYTVNGVGPATLDFRFKTDFGGYQFNFGYYKVTAALLGIDTSTDAGKTAYATAALAPGNAGLIFNDAVDNPGASASLSGVFNGGDTLGFFLVPNSTLTNFQTNQGQFSLTGNGSAQPPFAWPLFGDANANPGGFDQLMSFQGTSAVTSNTASMFAWEDITRIPTGGSDNSFSDLIFTVEGATASLPTVPEPATVGFGIALLGFMGINRSARRLKA